MPEQARSAERPSELASGLTALLGFWLARQTTEPSGRTESQRAQPNLPFFVKQPLISGPKGVPAGTDFGDPTGSRVGNRLAIELFFATEPFFERYGPTAVPMDSWRSDRTPFAAASP